MNYQLHITKNAEQDLMNAADYIEFTLLNPQAADDLLDKAEEVIGDLASLPQRNKLIEDPVLKAWGIRFILVNNYIAFYTIAEETKTVHILRFVYGKRNWLQLLKSEPVSLA